MTTNMYRLVVVEVAVCCTTRGHYSPPLDVAARRHISKVSREIEKELGDLKEKSDPVTQVVKHLVTLFSVTQWRISFRSIFLCFFFLKKKKFFYGGKFRQNIFLNWSKKK